MPSAELEDEQAIRVSVEELCQKLRLRHENLSFFPIPYHEEDPGEQLIVIEEWLKIMVKRMEKQPRMDKEQRRYLRIEKEGLRIKVEQLRWKRYWCVMLKERLNGVEGRLNRLEELLRMEEEKWLRMLLVQLEVMCQKRLSSLMSTGVSLSLSEVVSMYQGSPLPLDSVMRIQSSKFWMMECDVYADLLIICRWANPTTIYCPTCDKDVNAYTTSCGHVVCRTCLLKKWLEESEANPCPQCGGEVIMVATGTLELGTKRVHPTEDEEASCSKRACSDNISGDTSTQYGVLIKYSKKIVESLSHEPETMALDMLSNGFIEKEVLDQILELSEIKTKKATRLYSAVLGVVKHQPDRIGQFISMLTSEQSLHRKLLEEMETAVAK